MIWQETPSSLSVQTLEEGCVLGTINMGDGLELIETGSSALADETDAEADSEIESLGMELGDNGNGLGIIGELTDEVDD
jgi:hypothetical protein